MDWNKFENGELVAKVTPTTVGSFLRACEERGLKWRAGNLPTEYCPGILGHTYVTHNSFKPPLDGLGVTYNNYHDLPVVDWGSI